MTTTGNRRAVRGKPRDRAFARAVAHSCRPSAKPTTVVGNDVPRIAPPEPARSEWKAYRTVSQAIGLDPWPWQLTTAKYLYALGPDGQWLYPEVAAIVARQNGKTELALPHVVRRLEMGRRVLHAAQARELPRLLFNRLAPIVEQRFGNSVRVRRGAGQETIELDNGGFYKIAAATSRGPRGQTVDDLILDEVRELNEDFIGAVLPTMIASTNPQVLYLSNAGEEHTRVLNGIRDRANVDPALAYLEWSADPAYATDDPNGWVQANPAIGHRPGLLDNIGRQYRSHQVAGTLAIFETEHLCRWVASTRQRLVDEHAWAGCRADEGLGAPVRPSLGVSMSPDGHRATIAIAWQTPDAICLKVVRHDIADHVDIDAIGTELRDLALRTGAKVGFDPMTDAELVKHVRKDRAVSIAGGGFANASARFVNEVSSRRLRWADANAVGDDLTWTSRKADGSFVGSYHAVRAKDDHPITASLAAIRAVWLASGPVTAGAPRIR